MLSCSMFVAVFLLRLMAISRAEFNGYPGVKRGYRGMSESERAEYFHANGIGWPPALAASGWPPKMHPESAAYRLSREEIEAWARSLSTHKFRFDEWCALVQSRLMPSFTEKGFMVEKAPTELYEKLAAKYYEKVRAPGAYERLESEGMYSSAGGLKPKFYNQGELNNLALVEMKPLLEAWAGVPLIPSIAYGVRVYQNGTTLVNHVDRPETHVISCIIHIDHDLDEPWPIEIEDHEGRWHSVNLAPGEALYYESAKKFHARLTPMRGRHYGSVFVHFKPHNWNWSSWDTHVSVPPDFESGPVNPRGLALPPFLRYYEDYWRDRGVSPAPPLRLGMHDPVQAVVDTRSEELGERLLKAAQRGNLDAMVSLLDEGAKIDFEDANGWQALHEAARGGHLEVLRFLAQRGVAIEKLTSGGHSAHELYATGDRSGMSFQAFERLLRPDRAEL